MLSTTVDTHPSSWEQNIHRVCFTYNSSVHASTGFSPFFHMFGRPVNLMYGTGLKEEIAVPEYIKKLKEELLEAYALVRERCSAEYKQMKNIYARKVYGEPFIIVAISSGYIPQLYHPGNPGSFTSLGKDRIKYWKGLARPLTNYRAQGRETSNSSF